MSNAQQGLSGGTATTMVWKAYLSASSLSAATLTYVCLVALGCGGNGLPMVPVSGKVTFNGGEPPAEGRITFTPTETFGGLPRRPGLGRFGRDGAFVVSSFRDGDGLTPGRYRVRVNCLSGLPDVTKRDSTADLSYVPANYQPEDLVIEMDSEAIDLTYDVPPKSGRH